MRIMSRKQEILRLFPLRLRTVLEQTVMEFENIQEIRIRIHSHFLFLCEGQEYYLSAQDGLVRQSEGALTANKADIQEILQLLSGYSLYAYEDELRQGFFTIQGGHRIGVAGKVIVENHSICGMKHISYLNIRIAHEKKGCADAILPYIRRKNDIYHTLILSPPCCGKTTLLRDLVRQISDGADGMCGLTVGVVDERSEIAASYLGIPQNDVGMRTDVLDACPKAVGMMMLIRSMSPRVVAVDEVGSQEDWEAMKYVINCGVRLIATVHGSSLEDIKSKPILQEMVNQNRFERFVVLNSEKKVEKILDSGGNLVWMETI